jgi:glycosyltransferase involved in cell wall biosynthesis
MADIVRETGCGLLVDPTDQSAIAAAIREILGTPASARRVRRERALRAAHQTYNWDRQMAVLLDEYTALTGRRW